MKIYIILILFHLIGDIFLQRNFLYQKIFKRNDLGMLKRRNVKFIVIHVILYTLSLALSFAYLKLLTLYNILIVLVSHFLIDYIKCYKITYRDGSSRYYVINLIDQSLHVSILFIIANL